MRNITLSADEHDIDAAREKANAQRTTLNALFRDWLRRYVGAATEGDAVDRFDRVMEHFTPYRVGRKFTREEMNERRGG